MAASARGQKIGEAHGILDEIDHGLLDGRVTLFKGPFAQIAAQNCLNAWNLLVASP
jgi:hypothetical protein